MGVEEAARVWAECKREEVLLRARMQAAAEVLLAWFRRTGKATYRGRIGYAVASRMQLDTAKVKAELGDRLPEFQRLVTYEQLSLLKEPT